MLKVITGPMFSGKTKGLIDFCMDEEHFGRDVQVFKPQKDTRNSCNYIRSHDGKQRFAKTINSYVEIINYIKRLEPHVIAIDEAQFFKKGELTALWLWIQENRPEIHLVCVGLCQDSYGVPFGDMGDLMAMADNIYRPSQARCSKCGKHATRTYRKTDETGVICVGGAESYEPRCFDCWNEKI